MATSSNYLVSVPKLKGRENYSEWCFAVENFLVLEGMVHCVNPDAGKTPESTDDAKTKAKLILTIDPSIYVHIKSVRTSKELWQTLKTLFDDSGFTRRISLLRNLISIRLEDCTSMTSYVTQIVQAGQKLAGTGFGISDEWIGSIMLAGLTEKYMPMIMAIEHSGISITTDAIKSKLMDIEPEDSDVNNALACFRKQNKRHQNSLVGKDGPSGQKLTTVENKEKRTVKCYRCKQLGHYRNKCKNENVSSQNTHEDEKKHTNAFSAVFYSGNFYKSDWYVDSGACSHLTANQHWVINQCYDGFTKEIMVANKEKIPVLCSGNVKLTTLAKECEYEVMVEKVLCVPSLTTNLLSVSQLIRQGNTVLFTSNGCEIFNKINTLVATASLVNGVYKLDIPSCLIAAVAESPDVWHRRLGHVNSYSLNNMLSKNAVEGVKLEKKADISKMNCVVCCEGKQSRLPFPHEGNRCNELLNIIHTDICGPMETVSLGGSRYFLLFVDDHSRMTYVYFLKNKNEALQCFKEYMAKVENLTSKKIKILRSDNGREFCNNVFDNYLKKMGIIHQKSNAYTPEQNGLCERMYRTIIEKARCLLFEAKLDKKFWAEAINTAVYLQNRIVKTALNNRTPYELWTNTKPNLSHIRIFGSTVLKHIPKEKRRKWDKKSEKCILLGYPEDVKGYRVYNPTTKAITTSRDVIILEENNLHQESLIEVVETGSAASGSQDPVGDVRGDDSQLDDSFISTENPDETYVPNEESMAADKSCDMEINSRSLPPRERKKPDRYGFMCTENSVDVEDLSLEEALQGPEKEHWQEAVKDELKSFEDNKAWEVVDAPRGSTVVKCKWVLRKKFEDDNTVRFRARLVAKGCSQKYGVDYDETFSPVVRHTTLRLLFSLSVQLNLDIVHLDVKTAFLNGDLYETIYMQKPPGFVCRDDKKVLKLKKAVYGLKQAARAWHKKVDNCMLADGYYKSKLEPCLYTKFVGSNRTIVTLYVDDFFVFSNSVNEMKHLKEMLSNNFKIKDLGRVKQCLGMSVNFDREKSIVTLSQENYIDKLLSRFNMADCKTAVTPMETKLTVNKKEGCQSQNPYQQLIGSLMYLAVLTRPDIAYSVSYLSQFNNCHSEEHWIYAKRLLRYLKKTKSIGLKYCKNDNIQIEGFVDADWANDLNDRRSYTGYCFMLSGSAISWSCSKQKCIALSSTEAEYVAISEACKEAVYLRNLQYEMTKVMYKITLYNDNQSAHKLLVNPVFHNRTKHIDVRYHYCREMINNKIVLVKYLCTSDMPADLLTKSLNSVKHYKFMNTLGIVNVSCV